MPETELIKQRKPYIPTDSIDAGLLVRLRYVNKLSYEQIGTLVGSSRQNVQQRIRALIGDLPNNEEIQAVNDSFIPILKGIRSILSKNLVDSGKLKEASLNNVAYAFDKVNNAVRLEEGKSTQNVAYADMSREMKELDRDIRELQDGLPEILDIDAVDNSE